MASESALVLGGGGITGIGWELGLLAGLAVEGVNLLGADLVIGTSAGSVVGAQITSTTPLEALYERQLEPPAAERLSNIGLRVKLGLALALVRTRGAADPAAFGRQLGALSIKAAASGRLPTLDERFAAITSRLPSLTWPDRDLRTTAVDAESGEFRTFTRDDGVSLVEAVAASCAVPGVYPPVPIGGRTYLDGGVRSGANADLARGCARVIALTPIARSVGSIPTAQKQVDALRIPALVIAPDAAAVAAIGKNVLDPAARAAAARAGRAQASAIADKVRAVWV